MSDHLMQIRRVTRNADIWAVGCPCGWTSGHPLRGSRERAKTAWLDHLKAANAERETRAVAGLMRPRDYRNG